MEGLTRCRGQGAPRKACWVMRARWFRASTGDSMIIDRTFDARLRSDRHRMAFRCRSFVELERLTLRVPPCSGDGSYGCAWFVWLCHFTSCTSRKSTRRRSAYIAVARDSPCALLSPTCRGLPYLSTKPSERLASNCGSTVSLVAACLWFAVSIQSALFTDSHCQPSSNLTATQ